MDWRKKTVETFLCVTAASSLVRWKLGPPCRPIRCNYNFITPGFIRNLTYSFTSCDIGCCNYTLSTLSDVISVWLKGVQDTSEELICTNPVKSGFKGDDLTKKRSEPELIHSEPVKSHILSFLLQWLIKNFIGIIQAISFLQFSILLGNKYTYTWQYWSVSHWISALYNAAFCHVSGKRACCLVTLAKIADHVNKRVLSAGRRVIKGDFHMS